MKFHWISLAGALTFVVLAGAQAARATTIDAYLHNRDGVKSFAKESYYPAYKEFSAALETDPLNPEIHMNLARTLEANEEYEKAEKAYRGALALLAKDDRRRFAVLFNLAGTLGKQKRIDEALMAYQAALEFEPDSKDVKTNIELLWQGGGGGEGGEQDQQGDPGDRQGQGGKPQDPQQGSGPQEKKPQKFKGEDLSPQDVKKILDEIKNQEQGIRAQEYEKGAKQAPPAKDW